MNNRIDEIVQRIYLSGYSVYRNFLPEEDCDKLENVLKHYDEKFKPAGIGKKQDFTHAPEIRSDKIMWIEKGMEDDLDKIFFDPISDLILQLNRRCFLGLNSSEFHFAKYEPGNFYKKHRDAFNSDDARKISVILYLNKYWKEGDGGELKLYLENETLEIQPLEGTLVVFESHLEHEVLESNINRYSITGWLKSSKQPL